MRILDTIQKEANLNYVRAVDEIGPGNANHKYEIVRKDTDEVLLTVQHQNGPRKEEGSIPGVLDVDLLEIARDRLKSFQSGPFASNYNEEALTHVEAALQALNQRVLDRLNRDVLGKNEK
jgi:hypothetical protein